MLISGKGLTEIGDELSLSVKTISTHRTHILEKLQAKNNVDLVKLALEYKLL